MVITIKDDTISRKWLMECVEEGWIKFDTEKDENKFIHLVRDIAPSALPTADAVPVVRCKDCKWGREVCGNIECFADRNIPPEYHGYEWFCPNGERRTDG